MKKAFLISVLILGSFGLADAQRGRNPPPATPPGDPPLIDSSRQQDISGRSDALRMTEKFPVHTGSNSKVFRESVRPLYRASKKSEREMLAPEQEIAEKYAVFLSQKNTGLVKLVADQGCDAKFGVVVALEHCQKYTMPGAGSSYSFREDDYRMRFLGDLLFTGQLLMIPGAMIQGIYLDLGDLPLEQVGPETGGVGFLMKIEPLTDLAAVNEFNEKLTNGITDGNFTYRNYAEPAENRTYALRLIAYRGNNYRTVQGMTYDEFDFDKRKDLTVAFRVVRLNAEDNTITILWKGLADQKSPKLVTDTDN